MVLEAVDHRLPRGPRAQNLQNRSRLVDRVLPHPGSCRVRSRPVNRDRRAERALAAALDHATARLEEHCERAIEQLGRVPRQQEQPVALGIDLLALVKHVGHVAVGRIQGRRETELNRHPRLHVRCAYPSKPGPFHIPFRREVPRMRHRVDMTSQHHALTSPQRGTRDERVAVTRHRQVRQLSEGVLERVGERALRAADRGDIGERGRQLRAFEVQVKVVVHASKLTWPWRPRPFPSPLGGSWRGPRRAAR